MKYKKIISVLACLMFIVSTGCMSSEVRDVQNKINALPDTYSLDVEESLNDAKSVYESLEEKDRKSIDKSRIDSLEISKAVFEVQSVIDSLPEEYNIDSEESCKQAVSALGNMDSSLKGTVNTEKLDNFNSQRTEKLNSLISTMKSTKGRTPKNEADYIDRDYKALKECHDIIMAMPDEYLSDVDFEKIDKKAGNLKNVMDDVMSRVSSQPSIDTLSDFVKDAQEITDKFSIIGDEGIYAGLAIINLHETVIDYVNGFQFAPNGKAKVRSVMDKFLKSEEDDDIGTYYMTPAYLNDAFIELVAESTETLNLYNNIDFDSKNKTLPDMITDISEKSDNANSGTSGEMPTETATATKSVTE